MILYGIDSNEDPVELVQRIRAEAGLPPEDWNNASITDDQSFVPNDSSFMPNDPGFSSTWNDECINSGVCRNGFNHVFNTCFHGPNSQPLGQENWDNPNFIPADSTFTADDPSFTSSSWDNSGHLGSYNIGPNQMFNSRGPAANRFSNLAFRTPMFPTCGRFDTDAGPRGPRLRAARPFAAAPRGFHGERPIRAGGGFEAQDVHLVSSSKDRDGVGPNRTGLGRGRNAPVKPSRGNTLPPVTRGISHGGLYPRGGGFGPTSTKGNRKLTPSSLADRANRVGSAPRIVHQTISQSLVRPPVPSGSRVRPASQLANNAFLRNSAIPQSASPATNSSHIPFVPVTSSSAGAVSHTMACSAWNPMELSSSTFYSLSMPAVNRTRLYHASQHQKASTTFPTHGSHPARSTSAVHTTISAASQNSYSYLPTNAALCTTVTASEQCYMNTVAPWSCMSQADYMAYYNSYMQNFSGISSDANSSFVAGMSIQSPASSNIAQQTNDVDCASQAAAYAAYCSAFYVDPSLTQLMNSYPYSYDAGSKPT